MFALKMLRQRGISVRNEIEEAVSHLHNLGVISALMEIMLESNQPLPTTQLTETNAARAAWADGYARCLKDLTEFSERYLNVNSESIKPADFGAGERLLASGDLNPEEFEKIYGRKPSSGSYKQPKPWHSANRSESN